ncbi:MAG: nitrogen fixation sensor histidine kinase GnfL [Calditrichia bacterium]
MNSKLEKQKQIFSILNNKFSNLLDEQVDTLSDGNRQKNNPQTQPVDLRLVDRVYNFYRSIIQNINSGLITLDLAGDITFANRTAAKMLGYDVKELLNRHIGELFADDEESRKYLKIMFLPGKRTDDKEVAFRHRDGKTFMVGLSSSPIHDENNKFDGIVLLFRDLTEIRHLKMQVERMERLALLGEISAGIAHEIRNPLAGIKAAAQILEGSFGEDDFRFQIIERIIREVDKANRLLQEFFKFARPTKPKFKFHDIEMIIDGVYLLLAPKMQKRNIQFAPDFGSEVPQVFIDETQIEQVILNLFLNAIDAMPNGGVLKVSTFQKKLRILDKEKEKLNVNDNHLHYVLMEISDTGVGIPEDCIGKIFNPFYTTKTEGVGLGLSICSRLIEENGGKIDVVSKVGKGTTFIVALPAFIHR